MQGPAEAKENESVVVLALIPSLTLEVKHMYFWPQATFRVGSETTKRQSSAST